MITLQDYWMGRDVKYPLAMTPAIRSNAQLLLALVNELIKEAEADGVVFEVNAQTGTLVSSGWRPPQVNAATPNAAKMSKHMTGQACDVYGPGGRLAEWAFHRQDVLKKLGLWMEHPSATPTWLHVQSLPPRSGNRVFYP